MSKSALSPQASTKYRPMKSLEIIKFYNFNIFFSSCDAFTFYCRSSMPTTTAAIKSNYIYILYGKRQIIIQERIKAIPPSERTAQCKARKLN